MELWEKWVPIDNLPPIIYNDKLTDDENGIILEFSDENDEQKIIVHFDRVLSYRNTDEGSLLETWAFLESNYGIDFFNKWSFFKVKNSSYLNWFINESHGFPAPENIEHYVFATPNDVIEVLSIFPPDIKIIKNS